MLVGDLWVALAQARDRVGLDATVRACVQAMGSNIGEMTILRAEVRRIEGPPASLEWEESWGVRPPCPPELLPGPRLHLIVGGEDWADPDTGEWNPDNWDVSPDTMWEVLTAPCATVGQLLEQIREVPASLPVVAVYAVPGCTVRGGDDYETVQLGDREVLVQDLAQSLGDALYGESPMLVCNPRILPESPPARYEIPELEMEDWQWVAGEDGREEWTCVGKRQWPASRGWEPGHRAHVSLVVLS